MNIKRAVIIGTLTGIAITLITFGIKTKSFNIENKTTTPIILKEKTKSKTRQVNTTETISDLTNYTITFNSILVITQQYSNWNITYNTPTKSYTNLAIGRNANENGEFSFLDYIDNNTTDPAYFRQVNTGTNIWTQSMTITITGGTDAVNPQLITWLQNNTNINNAYKPPNIENGNFVSLQGLMLQILTMPFTFITQAFDVTLWPGTPYAFNFSNFIMSLIAIATILFIIKLFTSGFSIIGNFTSNYQNNKLTKAKIKETKSKTALNNRTNPNEKTSHVKTSKE